MIVKYENTHTHTHTHTPYCVLQNSLFQCFSGDDCWKYFTKSTRACLSASNDWIIEKLCSSHNYKAQIENKDAIYPSPVVWTNLPYYDSGNLDQSGVTNQYNFKHFEVGTDLKVSINFKASTCVKDGAYLKVCTDFKPDINVKAGAINFIVTVDRWDHL